MEPKYYERQWWGVYTPDMEEEGWIYNGADVPYKIKLYPNEGKNGKWWVLRFYHDGAWYSYCDSCGYYHNTSTPFKDMCNITFDGNRYDPQKEFNYCPICGKKMLKNKMTKKRGY